MESSTIVADRESGTNIAEIVLSVRIRVIFVHDGLLEFCFNDRCFLLRSTKISRQENTDVKVPSADEQSCPKCSIPWSDAKYQLRVKPVQMSKKQSAKIRNLIDIKSNLKKQRFAKKSARKVNNAVVSIQWKLFSEQQNIIHFSLQSIKCDVCDYKKNVILWKHTAVEKPKAVLKLEAREMEATGKKSKKRKRDKTAGLLLPKTGPTPNVKPTFVLPNNQPKKQPPKPSNSIKLIPPNQTKQKNQHIKPTIKLVAPQQSIQQKKHTLLHLANALKTKNNCNNQNIDKNKLEKMLR